ncbi:MarR family winged helix-turn-helix transcriptional regulator [Rhizobium glycinendophyticum]|uniref:MarR family transcriptional regulator n=1 Tax=Rhizobium glycinendophyticum TaxID=2589807 RepID=A0A504ULA6_9HYPH|nr:MarR family transcriptional regulator [Rhizobium glycinendophyticum]TPP11495.1 MarR family transcriptional regulator [Rhizobium glycinendophyticum]
MEAFLPYRLIRVADRFDMAFSHYCGPEDELSWAEWQVLWSLGEQSPITAKAISMHSGLSKTKISRAVKVLEDRGYLLRKRDRVDRRFELLSLTEEGLTRFDRLERCAHAFQRWLEQSVNIAYLSSLDSGLAGLEQLATAGLLQTAVPVVEESFS